MTQVLTLSGVLLGLIIGSSVGAAGERAALTLANTHGAKPTAIEAKADTQADTMTSPFKACEGIKIQTTDRFTQDASKAKVCAECRTEVQFAPKISALGGDIQETLFMDSAKEFLQKVTQATKTSIETSIKSYTELKQCFDTPTGAGCADKISAFKHNLKAASKERAISLVAETQIRKARYTKDAFAKLNPGPSAQAFKEGELSLTDFTDIKDKSDEIITTEMTECQKGPIDVRKFTYCKNVDDALNQYADSHKQNIDDITYVRMPVLSYLLKPKAFGSKDIYDHKNISTALGKLIEAGNKQKAITDKSLSKSVKFDQIEFMALLKSRDLVDHMAFTPMVEKVLAQYPGYCGIASALAKRLGLRTTMNYVAVGAGSLAVIAATAPVASTFGAGAAVFGADLTQMAGMALGLGFSAHAFTNLSTVGEGVRMGVRNVEQLDEAEMNALADGVLFPLNFWGVSAGSKAIAAKILNKTGAKGKLGSKAAAFVTATEKQQAARIAAEQAKINTKEAAKAVKKEREALIKLLVKEDKFDKKHAQFYADCVLSHGANKEACTLASFALSKTNKTAVAHNQTAAKPTGPTAKTTVSTTDSAGGNALAAIDDAPINYQAVDTAYLKPTARTANLSTYGDDFKWMKTTMEEDEGFRLLPKTREDAIAKNLCKPADASCPNQDDIIHHMLETLKKEEGGSTTRVKARIEKIRTQACPKA